MKTLTLIIPCYNEEDALPPLFERLKALKDAFCDDVAIDFLFVDDGSRDRTPEMIEAIDESLKPSRLVRHEKNQSLGGAIRTGFQNATGDFVALMDADCTYDPLYLVEMMKRMTPGLDVLTGSEFHPEGRIEGVTPFRLFLSRGMSQMYRVLFRSRLYSFSCLMRVFRREVLADIAPRTNGFLSCTEVLLNAQRLGYTIEEFPLVLTQRQHGESKMPVVRTILDHLKFMGKALIHPPKRSVATGRHS